MAYRNICVAHTFALALLDVSAASSKFTTITREVATFVEVCVCIYVPLQQSCLLDIFAATAGIMEVHVCQQLKCVTHSNHSKDQTALVRALRKVQPILCQYLN